MSGRQQPPNATDNKKQWKLNAGQLTSVVTQTSRRDYVIAYKSLNAR